MKHFAEFLLEFASTSWGPVVLVAHSFFESFILPVAHELFLIPVALARPEMSFVFALLSTVASTCGIAVGYGIGYWGGKPLILKFVSARRFILARKEIHKYDSWAVAAACFTPVPVKVFAVVAGAINLRFAKMMVIAFFARGARFFLVAALIYFYGATIREWILMYMNWIMFLVLFLFIGSSILWRTLEKRFLRKEFVSEPFRETV